MDNEHSNSSQSSGVAVADRVSSATKSSDSTASCSSSSTMTNPLNGTASTNNIRLLIKASSQQFEDITVESDLLWTVKRLKAHLSLVYPSKPVSLVDVCFIIILTMLFYNVFDLLFSALLCF